MRDATGRNEVYEFTAPATDRYRFQTTPRNGFNEPDADVILWARSHCAVEAANAELACVDNLAGSPQETIEFDLERNDTAYIFVDSVQPQGRCHYQLSVRRL